MWVFASDDEGSRIAPCDEDNSDDDHILIALHSRKGDLISPRGGCGVRKIRREFAAEASSSSPESWGGGAAGFARPECVWLFVVNMLRLNGCLRVFLWGYEVCKKSYVELSFFVCVENQASNTKQWVEYKSSGLFWPVGPVSEYIQEKYSND